MFFLDLHSDLAIHPQKRKSPERRREGAPLAEGRRAAQAKGSPGRSAAAALPGVLRRRDDLLPRRHQRFDTDQEGHREGKGVNRTANECVLEYATSTSLARTRKPA